MEPMKRPLYFPTAITHPNPNPESLAVFSTQGFKFSTEVKVMYQDDQDGYPREHVVLEPSPHPKQGDKT